MRKAEKIEIEEIIGSLEYEIKLRKFSNFGRGWDTCARKVIKQLKKLIK